MNDFHRRRQAVGGARRRTDDTVHVRLIAIVVHPHYHVQHPLLLYRSGYHNSLDALLQVAVQHRSLLELAGGLDDDITGGPVRVRQGLIGGTGYTPAGHDQVLAVTLCEMLPPAVDRVVIEQVRQRPGVRRRVVHLHEFHTLHLPGRPHNKPAHAPAAVYTNPGHHSNKPFFTLAHSQTRRRPRQLPASPAPQSSLATGLCPLRPLAHLLQ